MASWSASRCPFCTHVFFFRSLHVSQLAPPPSPPRVLEEEKSSQVTETSSAVVVPF